MRDEYLHELPLGVEDMIPHCNKCMWYNHIQRVEKDGTYIVSCGQKECTGGRDPFNIFLNAFIKNAVTPRY